jgi:hypothetical protein
VHDIFLPEEYPRQWVVLHRLFWNEQYLLQAFLTFNSVFEVLWASHYMDRSHRQLVDATFGPERYPPTPPTSFWMRRRVA